jgi:hypothetical protein
VEGVEGGKNFPWLFPFVVNVYEISEDFLLLLHGTR